MSILSKPESTTSLRNARIGYANLLTASTTTEAEKMLIPNTYERYRPTAGAKTVKFQMSASASINFVGIAAHNAATQDGGVDVTVEYAVTVGGALTEIEVVDFVDNGAVMLLFTAVTAQEIAITFNATTLGLEFGIIYAGLALEMQRPILGGVNPINLNSKTEFQSAMSETGQFLGRTITNEGLESSFSWRHLDDQWVRDNFMTFVQSAKRFPFFLKFRPDLYEESAFGFTTNDVALSYMGGGSKLMTASFNMKAHADV